MNFLRGVVDQSIRVAGKLLHNRKITPVKDEGDQLVKVNLGCGLRVAKGWLNIDGSLNAMFASWPVGFHKILYGLSGSRQYYTFEQYTGILSRHRFLYHDLALSLPLPVNSVDFIYSSHFFEHIFKDEAATLLKQCALALKSGGTIRISIPDLTFAVSLYALGRKEEMLEDYFFVSGKGSYLARHKYMYDFEMIQSVLEEAGFSSVTRCEYQKGRTPDIDFLDIYPDVSLFVEAVKN
ncbi:MAG: methyltransferase domain-containing protein [Gammaproteobacteria bacterium]|nr:methyltransferase domain-containing protein [Gammaproteobacteria bacterium]